MIKDMLDAYIERDADKAFAVWLRDEELDEMYTSLFRELLTYMIEDARNITAARICSSWRRTSSASAITPRISPRRSTSSFTASRCPDPAETRPHGLEAAAAGR